MRPSSTVISTEDDDELAQEIEEQVNEWSSNSNECFTIQIKRGDGQIASSFKPEFTYAIFGDEEAIFGYQGLAVTLTFAAHDLKPRLELKYSKIFEAQGDVRPTDIEEALREFLPPSAFSTEEERDGGASDFRPPGEKVHEYTRSGKSYETWCASLANPVAKQLLQNMQILVPMFIDGGSMLELDHEWTTQRWKVFLLYEVDENATAPASPYSLAGYGTSYRIFTFPDRQKTDFSASFASQSLEELIPSPQSKPNEFTIPPAILSPLDLPSRERLSQFLIFPSHQGFGHGQELYKAMYTHLTAPTNVCEFTVEDPNEKFDDLRDFCDLLHLRATDPDFSTLRIAEHIPAERLASRAPIPTDLLVPGAARAAAQQRCKIMPRQFDRLVEMHTLAFIPPMHRQRSRLTRREHANNPHDRAYYFWRLYVKQRLYVFNRDQLAQVEHAERVEKLEAALDSVQEAYTEMIERVEARQRVDEERGDAVTTATVRRKRKVVEEDEEDEEDEEEGGADTTEGEQVVANGHHTKKVRVG